jgi:CTP synthase
MLRLPRSSCRIGKYRDVVEKLNNNEFPTINIGVIYKYDNVEEAYLSIKESLVHAGVSNDLKIKIKWIKAEELEQYKDGRGIYKYFEDVDGVIVPGGFGVRSTEGKIKAIQYIREKKIPFLGICLGLQCAVIEFARNVCKLEGANSVEFDENTQHPVVHFVEGQKDLTIKSGTLRLGSYDCEISKDSLAFKLYGKSQISERHRHRYEVNSDYLEAFSKKGFLVSGVNPQTNLVEIMELDKSQHPFFVGIQAHPEFKSKLQNAHPLFKGLVQASFEFKTAKNTVES